MSCNDRDESLYGWRSTKLEERIHLGTIAEAFDKGWSRILPMSVPPIERRAREATAQPLDLPLILLQRLLINGCDAAIGLIV
ncbi:predicted protein [Botrytis cinerea T4]|uniref:Uncharacterized protein n=1 Tax=Botryotinia fuckeliana (strain T4) TaxID=999810 RepID=G2YDZ0_BOTF4|nr:predicted protein [Botrytis cinerea T4]